VTAPDLVTVAEPLRLLRLVEVCSRIGLGRTSLYDLLQAGEFPRPVRLGKRCVRWQSNLVEAWILARIAEGRAVRGGA
jgi:prophage regulatory protein